MSPDTEIKLLQDVAVVRSQLTDLLRTVNGNGHPGINDRLRDLEEKVDTHLEDCADAKSEKAQTVIDVKAEKARKADFSTKVILLAIGVIFSNVGVIIFAVVKLSIIHIP